MKKFDAKKIYFLTKWQLCKTFFRLVSNELIHEKTCFFAYFNGLCILISFSLLTINVRGVSNKHCLLAFFHSSLKKHDVTPSITMTDIIFQWQLTSAGAHCQNCDFVVSFNTIC